MKRLTYTIIAVLAAAFLWSLNPTAQAPGTRVAFLDSQAAIDSHPAGAQARNLEQTGLEELTSLESQLNAIIQRAQTGTATAADQEAFQTLQRTFEDRAQRIASEIAAAAEPAVAAVDAALAQVAAEQGIAVVFDYEVASMSGIIVYAEDGLDLTELVIQRIQQGQ